MVELTWFIQACEVGWVTRTRTMTDDTCHVHLGLGVGGLALTSALTLTLTEKKHRHWPGRCQRCVGSGASPTVVAQSLLLRRARLLAYLRHAPVPVGPPLPPPFSFPTGARVSPLTQPTSTLNKLIDQASSGRTRGRGTAGT